MIPDRLPEGDGPAKCPGRVVEQIPDPGGLPGPPGDQATAAPFDVERFEDGGRGIPAVRRPSAKRSPVALGGSETFVDPVYRGPRAGSSRTLAPPRPPGHAGSKSKNSRFGSPDFA